MEFDEMQKIWSSQNNEFFYGINENALHNRILAKKKQAFHITNVSELLSIVVNTGTGALILVINFFKHSENFFLYALSVWMLVSALYLILSRFRRMKGDARFDRSVSGDLAHAVSSASYQVRLSLIMRWNAVPVGILTALGVWESGKPAWMALAILVFFVLTNYAAGWEHNFYRKRKRELEILRDKLEIPN